MATVKEIKKELDKQGVDYPPKAPKADLELLLNLAKTTPKKIVDTPVLKKSDEIPRHKAGSKPDYIDPEEGFTDPNADPSTQA